MRPLDQVLDALFDPMVAMIVVIELHGDVVRQIMRLELPHGDEVHLIVI